MRLAGGPVIIAMMVNMDNNHGTPDTGLTIAAIILLNVGVIPLIVADLGLTRIMYVQPSTPPPILLPMQDTRSLIKPNRTA